MKHVVAGTAGHIDHGKTALVRALTGMDTDRLEEEKRRGISIDIGFAHLDLAPDLRVAFIDVPGHEKFIKNMLAGVAGIDFILFIIAADESIKPQTREHFDICRLLHIQTGLVALTKIDLVDPDTADVVKLEIEEFLKGSFLEGAPVIPVSAATGEGIKSLRDSIDRIARKAVSRDLNRLFRLPIDRSFVMPGFGAVVTGTLLEGKVALDDELQVYPGTKSGRVRGLQVHGTPAEVAMAGQRAALNIAGVEHHQITRGMTLAAKNKFVPTSLFDAAVELLPSAKPLKNRAPVHLHLGTAEVIAEIRTLDQAPVIEPGTSKLVRLSLREPLLALPGDRFILRMFSPVTTIGGGEVIDNAPPRRMPRAALTARAKALVEGSLTDRISLLVSEAAEGMPTAALTARTGMPPESLLAASSAPWRTGPATSAGPGIHRFGDWWMHADTALALRARWREFLNEFHRAQPLLPGGNKEELRSRLLPSAPAHVFDGLLAQDERIEVAGEFVRLAGHKISLQKEEQTASSQMESMIQNAGLNVPGVGGLLANSGLDAGRARSLLQLLLRERRVIRVTDDLVFHASVMDSLKQSLAARKGQRFGVTDFKDWTGVSRKYAIPLLEWLDRERVTRREGDSRIVL